MHNNAHHHQHAPAADHGCSAAPEFLRLKYFYGRMLGAHDLETEQNYFREKMKLHNRCLHGYGVVCGLEVEPLAEDDDCGGAQQANELCHRFVIRCGMAIDCDGNELVVRRDLPVDLRRALHKEDWEALENGPTDLYVSICYCQQPVDPVRPVMPDACGAPSDCAFGKLRDAVSVRVSLDPPESDDRCEPCCSPCEECCLLLARIDRFDVTKPLAADQVHNEVRRDLSLYVPTRITGISWSHAGRYSDAEAATLLGRNDPDGGLEFRFSRPVRTSTSQEGVMDVWVIEGGRGRHADIYNLDGELSCEPGEWTTWLRFRQKSGETLQRGDRLLIVLRSAFVLDRCCRPLDGVHTGGKVPLIPEERFQKFRRDPAPGCETPPGGFVWTSGQNLPGVSFESWIFIGEYRGNVI